MDLIDRYVAAVRRHLPRSASPDIVQELSDNLRSEAEEREQQAGRTLTADEQAALLKPHGHPWLMASRYMKQQHLVGPGLYPYYLQALTMVVFWVVLPITLLGGAAVAIYSDHPGQAWARVLGAAWNGAIYAVGIVTIVFAVLERERVRITAFDNWNPSKLPDPEQGRAIPRSETLPGLVMTLSFLVWWAGIVRLPSVSEYVGVGVQFVAAPIWSEVYWPVMAVLIGGIAIAAIDLVRPFRTLTVSIADIAVNLFSAGVAAVIVRAGHFVDVIGDPTAADKLTRADRWLNASISWTMIVLAGVILLDVLYEIWMLSRTAGYKRAVKLV